jgi:PAS domain S-box-containing protein
LVSCGLHLRRDSAGAIVAGAVADDDRTRDQLLEELRLARQRIAALEGAETERSESDERSRSASEGPRDQIVARELRFLEMLLTEVPDYVYFKDANRRFVRASDSFRDLFGLGMDEIIGKTDEELFPAEIARHSVADDQRVIETGTPIINKEEGGEPIEGTSPWVLTTKLPWRDRDGRIIGLFGISRDITDRKRAEEALRESEDRFEKAFRAAPQLVAITRVRDGLIVDANDGFARVAGVSREELIGRTTLEMSVWANPEDRERFRAEFMEKGRVRDMEIRVRRRSGEARSMLLSGEAITLGGEPHIITVAIDITARKEVEEARRERLEFNQTMLSASPVGIATYGPDGQCVSGNEAIAKMVGATMEQVLAQNFLKIESWRKSGLQEDARTCLSDGASRRREIHVRSTFGKQVSLECRVSRFYSEGQPHLLLVVDDITERIRAEEERRSLEAQVQHAQKLESLGVLAGGIAHDFNNLLTGVLGNAALAKREVPQGSGARECIDEIERASHRAAELCREMLAYAGRGKFETERLDLSSAVREITVLLESSISKRADLELDLASDLPAIEADGAQIRQVVMNLITNASEALDDKSGRVIVRTRAETRDDSHPGHEGPQPTLPGGRYVRLEVTDDGCGMDEETRAKIFDPFFTTKFTGRGLGMAAALGIVRGHKGDIQVDSEPGGGTTVRVWLPVPDPEAARVEPRSPVAPEPTEARARDLTVLVVDDEPLVRSLARRVLERGGYGVLVAEDGHEAVQIYEERCQEIDVVLLDLTMPRMGGEEALRELQRIRGDVRVILSSGFSREEATTRYANMGLAGFLQKPYDGADLKQAIRAAHDSP